MEGTFKKYYGRICYTFFIPNSHFFHLFLKILC